MADLTGRSVRIARVPVVVAVLASLGLGAAMARAQTPTASTPADSEPAREAPVKSVAVLHDNDGLPNLGNTFATTTTRPASRCG